MTLKLCVIGAGRMGRRHIAVAQKLGFQVEGIHDPSTEAMSQACAEHLLPSHCRYASPKEMLASVKPDGVVVSSTAPSHAEYVCLVAEAETRYVLCEKPMAASLSECDRMIVACRERGTILAVNHQMRFMDQYTTVKGLCGSEEFGGLRSITVASSNMGLAMNGSHYFEVFRYLTGEDIRQVSFWMDPDRVPNPRGPQYDDRSGHLRAVGGNGVRMSLDIGADQGHGIHIVYGCRFGQIFVDELAGFLRSSRRKAEDRALPTTRYGMPAVEEAETIAPADVIEPTLKVWQAMTAGSGYPDGESGRHAVTALVAARLSGEQGGKPVDTADLPRERVFAWA